MLELLTGWFSAVVGWVSHWIPEPGATIVVGGALCLLIGIPVSELSALVDKRWWSRAGRLERRAILFLAAAAVIFYSRGHVISDSNFKAYGIYAALATLVAIAYSVVKRIVGVRRFRSSWETRTETAPGFPVITWQQDVDTGLQGKHVRGKIEYTMMLCWMAMGVALGWVWGGWGGAGVGFIVTAYFAPAINRNAVAPKLENVGGFAPVPGQWGERPPSDAEREADARPVVETWEAQAYVIAIGGPNLYEGEPHFVVQWRNPKTGDALVKAFEPWPDLAPFELDSYERLFGYRGTPLQYRDPWVITTRTRKDMLELARDMAGQYRVQQVFFDLTQQFGVDRRAAFYRERALERRRRGLDQPLPAEPAVDANGIRTKPRI